MQKNKDLNYLDKQTEKAHRSKFKLQKLPDSHLV